MQSVYALRVKAAPFGHNAPLFVRQDPKTGETTGREDWPLEEVSNELNLDAEYDQIKPGSWVVIERPQVSVIGLVASTTGFETMFRLVLEMRTISRAAYGITGKITQLVLSDKWCEDAITYREFLPFLRGITVYAQSEELILAEEPILADNSSTNEVKLKLSMAKRSN